MPRMMSSISSPEVTRIRYDMNFVEASRWRHDTGLRHQIQVDLDSCGLLESIGHIQLQYLNLLSFGFPFIKRLSKSRERSKVLYWTCSEVKIVSMNSHFHLWDHGDY